MLLIIIDLTYKKVRYGHWYSIGFGWKDTTQI